MELYQKLATLLVARANCQKVGNSEWKERHENEALRLVRDYLPSGSGFDSGTSIDLDNSGEEKLVLSTSFHHMDEYGFYCGWTEHNITVKPNLLHDFTLTISGKDRNGIKDYIHDVFQISLRRAI